MRRYSSLEVVAKLSPDGTFLHPLRWRGFVIRAKTEENDKGERFVIIWSWHGSQTTSVRKIFKSTNLENKRLKLDRNTVFFEFDFQKQKNGLIYQQAGN